jgi:hypothetical protein
MARQLVSGTLACYAIRQSVNHHFKFINFLLIPDISVAIASLNSVAVLLAKYLSISLVRQVIDIGHNLPMQPGSKRWYMRSWTGIIKAEGGVHWWLLANLQVS